MPSTGAFVGGCVVLFVTSFTASAGGVGGGGLSLPVLLLVFGYSFDTAVSLSLCVVLGVALSQFYLNISQHNPYDKLKPLIWFELVVILLPAQLGGSHLGSYLASILPESLLYILAVVVLGGAGKLTFDKGVHKRQEELEHEAAKEREAVEVSINPFHNDLPPPSDSSMELGTSNQSTDSQEAAASSLPFEWPVRVLMVIGAMFVVYVLIIVAKSQVKTCSDSYILLFFACYIPLISGVSWGVYFNRNRIVAQGDKLESISPPSTHGSSGLLASGSAKLSSINPLPAIEKRIFVDHAIFLPCFVFGVGIVCSLLGVGGGEMLSPMMLHYHIPPLITSATSPCLSLLNTSSLVIRALVNEEINLETGCILCLVGLGGGFLGRKFGLQISRAYNRTSTIIFALCGAILLSALFFVYKLIAEDFDGSLSSPC